MRQNRVLIRFLLTAGVLYVVWDYFYKSILEENGVFIREVGAHVASVSVSILNMLGYDAVVAPYKDPSAPRAFETLIVYKGQNLVWIDSGCTGLTLMALFAGFILAYPGPIAKKAWYIPTGLVAIYLVNIFRVVALALNHIASRSTFDFNHKYTYTLVTYLAIFGLWMLWANRLSGVSLGSGGDDAADKEDQNKSEPTAATR